MKGSIEEILNELGWDSGFRIPVANEQNKQLEKEIEKKIKKKIELVETLEVTNDYIKSFDEYLKNIKIQHEENQKLLTAYGAQLEAESHLHSVTGNEETSITHDIKNLEKEKQATTEKIFNLKKEIKKLEEKINLSKATVVFDKTKLFEMEEALNHDEDNEKILQKYLKLDRKKWKELELKRQKLIGEVELYRSSMYRLLDEIYEMEIMLDRTSKFYVQALEERRQLIDRWTQSVEVLRQRDNGIQETLREMETLKEIAKEKMNVLEESELFMQNQLNNNKYLADLIKAMERRLHLEKEERNKIINNMTLFEVEYQGRKKILREFSCKIQRLKSDIKATNNNISTKKIKIEECQKIIQDMKSTIVDINNKSLSIDDRVKQLESMLEKEEKRKLLMMRETKRLQDLILRTFSQITELENEKKSLDLQKQRELKKIEIFAAYEVKEEERLSEKKNIIRQLDIEIQKCEINFGKTGNYGADDKEVLERKQKMIEELQETLNEKTAVEKLLQTHISNLQKDVRKTQNNLNRDNEELLRLKNKKQDFALMMDGGEKQLKSARRLNEEKQVSENILVLRTTQAEQMMKNIGNKLYNLELYRLHIDTAMKERMVEIKVQKEALNFEKRFALNECAELRSSIAERNLRTQHLQSRYDIIITALGNNESDGKPVTTTFLKIQNAQEKYELQEQGDKLDATIRRTEQEIRSMENTLRIVNACNDKYKVSLDPGDNDDAENLEKTQLDKEMSNAFEQLTMNKNRLEKIEEDFQKMQSDQGDLEDKLRKLEEEKELKRRVILDLERQIFDQTEKLLRADKSLRKLYKDIQKMCENSHNVILMQEKDIANRELQEQNNLALHRITEFTIRHVEAEVYVKKLLATKNIILPCAQHLRPSPSPSFCESSRTSLGSSSRSKYPSTRESLSQFPTVQPKFTFEVVGETSTAEKKHARSSSTKS